MLGGYLLLFPRNRVRVLMYGGIAHVPAIVRARHVDRHPGGEQRGAMATTADTGGGGVAYLAHVGGFVAGLVLAKMFARRVAQGVRPLSRRPV